MPQRSLFIVWLLMAATIAVDLVATMWIFASNFNDGSATLFLSLAYAQLSLICLWAVLGGRTIGWRWFVPFVTALVCALITSMAERGSRAMDGEELLAYTGLYALHVVAALALLWTIRPTRIGGSVGGGFDHSTWRFSIWNLLILTTALAIILALFGRNRHLGDVWGSIAMVVAANMSLLIAVLAIGRLPWPRLLRLAAVLAAAAVIGLICEVPNTRFAQVLYFVPYSLIQAFVMWTWLELSPITPRDQSKPVADVLHEQAPTPPIETID